MADSTQAVRQMPGRPPVSGAREPAQRGPGARAMTGVPVTTQQPASKAGGKQDVRVTDTGRN